MKHKLFLLVSVCVIFLFCACVLIPEIAEAQPVPYRPAPPVQAPPPQYHPQQYNPPTYNYQPPTYNPPPVVQNPPPYNPPPRVYTPPQNIHVTPPAYNPPVTYTNKPVYYDNYNTPSYSSTSTPVKKSKKKTKKRSSSHAASTSRNSDDQCGCCCGGIFILFIIIGVVSSMSKTKPGATTPASGGSLLSPGQSSTYVPPPAPQANTPFSQAVSVFDGGRVRNQLQDLQRRMPEFSERGFMDTVRNHFTALLRAWSENDLEQVKGLMSRRECDRWSGKVQGMIDNGERNILDNILINKIDFDEAGVNGAGNNFIKVKIQASMSSRTVDAYGNFVRGEAQPKPFTEFWTFVFMEPDMVPSDRCPTCEHPYDNAEKMTKCPFCGTPVTVPVAEWLLDSISTAK